MKVHGLFDSNTKIINIEDKVTYMCIYKDGFRAMFLQTNHMDLVYITQGSILAGDSGCLVCQIIWKHSQMKQQRFILSAHSISIL